MFRRYNANPDKNRVGDCTVRAISKLLDQSWMKTYWGICLQGAISYDMPSSDAVWGAYLWKHGYRCQAMPNLCPDCYTVKEFCREHPEGKYLLATGGHVVAVVDGDYYDTWDSGDEVPIYCWRKDEQ